MNRHDSQRGWFAYELYNHMQKDKDIWLICIDLGYKVFDAHLADFKERVIVTGASEQFAMDMSVGLALSGKKPFVYSITPFLLYRPFETIRTYINHEKIPVRLVGSGRDQDYAHDGFSHDASDDKKILATMENIDCYWPQEKELIPDLVARMVIYNHPQYINLKR